MAAAPGYPGDQARARHRPWAGTRRRGVEGPRPRIAATSVWASRDAFAMSTTLRNTNARPAFAARVGRRGPGGPPPRSDYVQVTTSTEEAKMAGSMARLRSTSSGGIFWMTSSVRLSLSTTWTDLASRLISNLASMENRSRISFI